jgi:pilus assembly protein CpaF
VLVGGIDIPIRAIRDQIASAIDLVVHVSRMPDGRRGVTSITEIAGIGENQVLTQELFQRSVSGKASGSGLVRTGIRSRLENSGEGGWD